MGILNMVPPRAAIFISREAAAAIRKITGVRDRICMVRIMDVRPMVKCEKESAKDVHLVFRLKDVGGATRRRDDYRFGSGRVFVCINKKYALFLVGGRVLHYQKCVDGAGFILWPLSKYRFYRRITGATS